MRLPAQGMGIVTIAVVGVAGTFIAGCHGVGRVRLAGCFDSRSQPCLNAPPAAGGACCNTAPHLHPGPADDPQSQPQLPTLAPPQYGPQNQDSPRKMSPPSSRGPAARKELPPYSAYYRRSRVLQNIDYGLRKLHSEDVEFPPAAGTSAARPEFEERVPELAGPMPTQPARLAAPPNAPRIEDWPYAPRKRAEEKSAVTEFGNLSSQPLGTRRFPGTRENEGSPRPDTADIQIVPRFKATAGPQLRPLPRRASAKDDSPRPLW